MLSPRHPLRIRTAKTQLRYSTLQAPRNGVNVLCFQAIMAGLLADGRGLFRAVCADFDGFRTVLQTARFTLITPIATTSAISMISSSDVSDPFSFSSYGNCNRTARTDRDASEHTRTENETTFTPPGISRDSGRRPRFHPEWQHNFLLGPALTEHSFLLFS